MLFNKTGLDGGTELRDLLGFIDSSTNFEKWKTWIELSVRQVTALTGKAVYKLADDHYNSNHYHFPTPEVTPTEETSPKASEIKAWKELDMLTTKFQLANALFAYVRLLPSLDAGHSNSGRKKTAGETERSLTAVEAYKDENNILNLGYEALEDLLSYLEETANTTWLDSDIRTSTANLLVPDLDTFNQYFRLNSARMFYTLIPMMKDVQRNQVVPVITSARVPIIIDALKKVGTVGTVTTEEKALITLTTEFIRNPMVLATMAMALERLPIEILPEGLVQVSIVGTVKEKQVAANETRIQMIASLRKDAEKGFKALQEQISVMDGALVQERYVEAPVGKDTIKGFRF